MASMSIVETRNNIQFSKNERYYDGKEPSKQVGMTTLNPLPLEGSTPINPANGVTPLMQACQQGKDVVVRQLLHKDPSTVHQRDKTGKTALHYCVENASLVCIDQLLSADPSLISARDEDGYTALHLATIAGNKAVVKFLLSKGADVHAKDNEEHTVVHWATVCGEVELLDILIDAGADPSTPDIHGAYPIHYAAQMCGPNSELGHEVHVGLRVLQKLLQRGVSVSVKDHDGRQPLLWAASAEVRPSHVYCPSGSADAILALVNAGADVAADDKDGLTALHCAASRGHLDCLDVLITLCSAEVDTLDSNGCTPLFYAVTLGHADCTELLLKHGAIPDRQDRKGRTPAHCGAAKGQLETLKLLHRRGADLWRRNIKGDLPLHEACQSGRKDLVMWLLSLQPDAVNSPNNDGRCPLHIAAINNNIEMCKVLMDSKATVNPIMRNSRGQLLTPVDAAVARGNRGCAKYLQLHGGLPASKLTDKRALQLAMQKALEAGPVMDPTGATPSELNGDVTDASTPNLAKTPSTLVLTPTLLSPSDALQAQTRTSALSQSSVALQMGTSSFSPPPVDSQSQTDASPQLHDAGTYTSDENIRELLLQEERILREKLMQEESRMKEDSQATQQQTTASNEANDEVHLREDQNKAINLSEEYTSKNESLETTEEDALQGQNLSKKNSEDSEINEESQHEYENVNHEREDEEVTNENENEGEEVTNENESKGEEVTNENESEGEKVTNENESEGEEVTNENKTLSKENEKKSRSENEVTSEENKNESKIENDSESVESQATENTSETSQTTVKSKNTDSLSETEVHTTQALIKKTVLITKQGNVSEENETKSDESTLDGSELEENENELDQSECYSQQSESGKVAVVALSKTQKSSKEESVGKSKNKETKGQLQKMKTLKTSVSSEAESEKSKTKKTKKVINKSRQGSVANESENETKTNKKVIRQNTNKTREVMKDPKETKTSKTASRKNVIKKRTRSEGTVERNVQKKNITNARSKSLDKIDKKASQVSISDASESSKTVPNEKLEKTKKKLKGKRDSKIELEREIVAIRSSSQEGNSEDESTVTKVTSSQAGSSSEEAKSSKTEKLSQRAKQTRSNLSVPERELGDGASEDGEAAGVSGSESDSNGAKNKTSVKKKKVSRKRSSKSSSSKSNKSKIVEESDADQSSSEFGASSSSSSSSREEKEKGEAEDEVSFKELRTVKRLSRPRTAIKSSSSSKFNKDKKLILIPENASLYSNDERTHEMVLSSSGRDFGLVREAPSDSINSPSKLSIQDNQNFKKPIRMDSLEQSSKDIQSISSPDSSSDEGTGSKDSKTKRRIRKIKIKSKNGSDSNKTDGNAVNEEGDTFSETSKSQNESKEERRRIQTEMLTEEDGMSKRLNAESVANRSEEEPMSGTGSEEENEENDPMKRERRIARSKRRKLKVVKRSEMKSMKEISRSRDKKEAVKRVMSGGPRKVENMELNLRKKKSPATGVSVTRAMQSTMRKYALERRLFQQLLELKRMQIRNSRANEHIMIKRLVDEYNKEGNYLGLRDYSGPFNFASYEKYLYDQLRTLQTSQGNKIPRFKSNDDVEKLTRALRKANVPDFTQTLDERDRNSQNCNHTTHRCHHAIHAYTGVPCAAYLAHYNRNIKAGKVNLPKIPPPPFSVRGEDSEKKNDFRSYDSRKPLMVELQHGSAKQQISLPTNFLDKSQKYQLTVSIQPSSKGNKKQEVNITTETENLAKSPESREKPSSAHSAPDATDSSEATTSFPPKELHSAPTDGNRTLPAKRPGPKPLPSQN